MVNTLRSTISHFNPRAHEGHDVVVIPVRFTILFQSTCPRGARLTHPETAVLLTDFNPRAHEGHDVGC